MTLTFSSFGKNEKKIPKIHSYLSILIEKFEDEFIRILLILGVVSMVLSISFKLFPYESLSIFFAVGLNALVASLCDYGKEQ
jgi:magnesium-transporting ATPase (P-type)